MSCGSTFKTDGWLHLWGRVNVLVRFPVHPRVSWDMRGITLINVECLSQAQEEHVGQVQHPSE